MKLTLSDYLQSVAQKRVGLSMKTYLETDVDIYKVFYDTLELLYFILIFFFFYLFLICFFFSFFFFFFLFFFFFFLNNEEACNCGHMMYHMTLCHKPRTL